MTLKAMMLAAMLAKNTLACAQIMSPVEQATPVKTDLAVLILGGKTEQPADAKNRQKLIDNMVGYLGKNTKASILVCADPVQGITKNDTWLAAQKTAALHPKHVVVISLFDALPQERSFPIDDMAGGTITFKNNALSLDSTTQINSFYDSDYYDLIATSFAANGQTSAPEVSILDYSCQGALSSDALSRTTAKRAVVFSAADKTTEKNVSTPFKLPLKSGKNLTAADLVTAALLNINTRLPADKQNAPRMLFMGEAPSDTVTFDDQGHIRKLYNSGHQAGVIDPMRHMQHVQQADPKDVAKAYKKWTRKFLTAHERTEALALFYAVGNPGTLATLSPEMGDKIRLVTFAYGQEHPEIQSSLLKTQIDEKIQFYTPAKKHCICQP